MCDNTEYLLEGTHILWFANKTHQERLLYRTICLWETSHEILE